MATDYMSQFSSLLSGMKAPVGTGAGKAPAQTDSTGKPKYTIDPSIPDNIRKIIEDSENSGTAIPDKIDGGTVDTDKPTAAGEKKSFVQEMMETLGKSGLGGAMGGALSQGASILGGGAGAAAAAVNEKLGGIWIRWIVIVVGILILVIGLYMFSNQATLQATGAVLNSGPGKLATKLIPAGKAASLVKGLI